MGSKSNHLIPAISERQGKERGNSCSDAEEFCKGNQTFL
jgi:hypothetical protein